ncbi:hypothetical protein AGDE_03961 [Angomonas deanei]|uniref:Uncharacterized protein n=1 Tax=Angomonas deanei TaxID=59799 RepID=A0A7G2C6P5_9TRYP|nr:hypothetical protein AGDE_03961 [Angomonas deanei]CAD2215135.1 hypothetical protein, conserved [Angomonas deanei]|eukprot:EPY39967.1 hypothetical protein AGDE_03961 [Angomonas deanei]
MQLVSDLQQRPKKGRLKMEKSIVPFYDLCAMVQIVVFIIQTVTIYIGAYRTFVHNFFVTSHFQLAPALVYKTANCTFETTRNIYAFNNVTMKFTSSSVNDVFVDSAIQFRLSIFVMAVALFLGMINHVFVEINLFKVQYRNFTFWKDILSACELILLGYVIQIAVAAGPPSRLAQDYLNHCGIQTRNYLPYVGVVPMYVFAGVGFGSYAVGLTLYLYNSLPKYGVMSAEEIEEYKSWLRARRAEIEQSRVYIEQAKQAHARVQMIQSAEYNVAQARNDREKGRPTPMPFPSGQTAMLYDQPPPTMMPYPQPQPPYNMPPEMMMMQRSQLGMPQNGNLPPPQAFGMNPNAPAPNMPRRRR